MHAITLHAIDDVYVCVYDIMHSSHTLHIDCS